MSAFVSVAVDVAASDVQVDYFETGHSPAARVDLGRGVQLVVTSSDPAALRALSVALSDLAVWREGVIADAAGRAAAAKGVAA